MPRDSNCDYLAFVVWVETKAALREMIPDHAEQHAHTHSIRMVSSWLIGASFLIAERRWAKPPGLGDF
jgi:hypothetical protein